MPAEITDHGAPRVLEEPDTNLQPNVDPIKQAVNHDHSQSPTVYAQELGAYSMRKEATFDLPKLSENDGFEGNSNPDNEPTPPQEISKPAPTIGEDEGLRIDKVPQEGNSGDSGGDDLPIFEGGLPRGRIVSSVAGRPPPKPKPRPK